MINKKFIISKTVIFLFVIVFVSIFKGIFGSENTLIGVTTVTAMLMFLSRDLTLSPLKNTIKLILINLLIGIGSVLALSNIWIGIFANFISVFIVSYTFCYNLRSPLYVPFLLQYLFLLSIPVTSDKIGMRFIALISGAIFIMLTQLIANKNKLTKSGSKVLSDVCGYILSRINNIENNIENSSFIDEVNTSIDQFREMVYDKRESNYYLTEEAKVKLNISAALESINSTIYGLDGINKDSYILDALTEIIKDTKKVLDYDPKSKEQINKASYDINALLEYYEKEDISDLLKLQLLDSILLLCDNLEILRMLDLNHYNNVNRREDIPQLFSKENIRSRMFGRKSIKFCYAMRLAILITVGGFIVDYFNLIDGRWILFTLLSLTTPIYETSKDKIKYRVWSTIVGSIIVYILFSILRDETSRLLIVMLSGYLQGYVSQYKHTTIFVTISAIGSAAIVGNVEVLTITRITYVILGTIIALIANKYLFPYKVEDSNKALKDMYYKTINKMFKEIQNLLKGKKRPEVIKNLLLLTSLIESKVRLNEELSDNSNYKQVIKERRYLVANIYELYMIILKEGINAKYQKQIIEDITTLIQYKYESNDVKSKYIGEEIKSIKDIKTKIILSNIIVILNELDKLNKLNYKAQI